MMQKSVAGKLRRFAARLFLGALSLVLAACQRFSPGREPTRGPLAVGGILDLRSWDFDREGIVGLSGEWLFAPGALLGAEDADDGEGPASLWRLRSVPDFWKGEEAGGSGGRGAGTYRLLVLLPPDPPPLGIGNRTGLTSFELEADGRVIASAGRPDVDPTRVVSAYHPGVARLERAGASVELIVRTSNRDYRSGGMWQPFKLGAFALLERRRLLSFYSAVAIAVAGIAISLNNLVVFLFRRRERAFLAFALCGLTLSIRPLVTGEYPLTAAFPDIYFGFLVRLEYASAILAVPAVIAFFRSLFPSILGKRLFALLTLPFAPFVLAILALPLYPLTWSIFAFYALALAAIFSASSFILTRAVRAKAPGGRTMLAAGCVIAAAGINDLLYSEGLIETGNLIHFGIALFVLLQSVVLARRFTRAFEEVELLSSELGAANAALREEIRSGDAARGGLEASLAEKETLLKEVHHRVKNSLQIVSSIVALQARNSKVPGAQELSLVIRNRIRVISMAHERLYDLESGDRLDLGDYARELLLLHSSGLGDDLRFFDASVDAAKIAVDAATCIDIGLILTELLTNSIKHAIIPAGGGAIRVAIADSGKSILLTVSDDGRGFPPGFDPAAQATLGFRIVIAILGKRNGSVSVSPGPGGIVACEIPLTACG